MNRKTKRKVVEPQPAQDERPSGNSKKVDAAISKDVRELLECPVCFNIMNPPIYQCSNGHTLCSGCKPTMNNRCPTCSHELGNIRCLALEKAAAAVEVPCKYQDSGCLAVFRYCNKLEHESQCSFGPYKCPLSDSKCSIIGGIPFLMSHMKDYHKVLLYNTSIFGVTYPICTKDGVQHTKWRPVVYGCFEEYFCLHFEVLQLGITTANIAFLRFMGSDEAAKNYTYSLQCVGKGRILTWEGVPRSIRDSQSKVRESLDGLIIQHNFFACGEEKELKLTVSGSVSKDKQRTNKAY